MKNIFNHTKRPYTKWEEYEAENDDWDAEDEEAYYEDTEYIEDEEDGVYYADGAYGQEPEEAYDAEAYGQEPEEAYYAEAYGQEPEEPYYTEAYGQEPEEAYYAEAYGQEPEEAYYTEAYGQEPEEAYDTEAYGQEPEEAYDTEEYEQEPEEAYYIEDEEDGCEEAAYEESLYKEKIRQRKRREPAGKKTGVNPFLWIRDKFRSMSVMDRIITSTGVAVLILAIVTGSVYAGAKMIDGQLDDFVSVGAQLGDISLIGERGLMAVADAEAARLAAAEIVEEEEENTDYGEADYNKAVTVKMEMVSVLKDLKIKFTNKETGKLVANVPFSVAVTTPSGKSETWTDDDMDGIIYKTELAPGKYQVAMQELSDEKYKTYTIPTTMENVEVKKDIAYKKVDVKNEIQKGNSEEAAKEDTKKEDIKIESALQNTVEWVAHGEMPVSYTEVAKSAIPAPGGVASSGKSFLRMADVNVTLTPGAATLKVGETTGVSVSGLADLSGGSWSSSAPAVATVNNGTVEAKSPGQATVSFEKRVPNTDVSASDTETVYKGSCVITVTAAQQSKPGTVTLTPASLSVAVGGNAASQASVTGFAAGTTITYSAVSSNPGAATVAIDAATGKMTITGIAAGSTDVTVTATASDGTSNTAVLKVTVTGAKTIALNPATMTVPIGEAQNITATVTNAANTAITAVSSDANKATVSVNGTTVTVTGVAAGSATVTVTLNEDQNVKATCAVTVTANPKNDTVTKLKSGSGEQIYVQENGNYREAVYADYYKAAKFFVKGESKKTGWWEIGGKMYFFDKNGNKVTGEQVIQGAKYNFGSDGALVVGSGTMGIDVSKWNGTINWNAVKNSGVSYVIIRCGYRGSSQGGLFDDPKFEENIKGATAAGLKVGVYFFSQAINEVEAVYEASAVLEKVRNYKISYPIFLDVESSGGRGDTIDKATRTAVCKAFCETIQDGGYTAGIYANKSWLETKLDPNALSNYKIWLAQYAAQPSYKGRYDLWQYTSKGRVDGISGDVDLNLSYLGY